MSSVTFIVRVVKDSEGRVTGTVEQVRTREKDRFDDAHAIGDIIVRMVNAER